MKNNDNCVFCKKVKDLDPYGDRDVVGFEPLNPITPGHWLIVPKKHVTDYTKDSDITALVMAAASELARARGYKDSNIITSQGKHATQTIMHFHVHVVPRRPNDGLHLPWTGQVKDK